MSLTVHLINQGECARTISQSYAKTQEPTLIDCSYSQNNVDNRFIVYVELATGCFNEALIAQLQAAGRAMRPGKKIYMLVGLKPENNVNPALLEKMLKSPYVHGILLNAFNADQISTELKVKA